MALKAAVIGLGVGLEHLKAYREMDCEIVGIVDLDKELRQKVGDEYGCPSFAQYSPFEATHDIKGADVVSVCTWDQTHYNIVKSLMEFGKHVVVEKPPCLRNDHLDALKRLVASRPRQSFMCSLPLTFHPLFREILDTDFGDIYLIEAAYHWGRMHKLAEWRADCPDYSMVLGAGLHMIDLMLWAKEFEIGFGAALGTNMASGFKNFDTYAASFNFADGALGSLVINGGYEGEHQHMLSVWGTKAHRTFVNTVEVDKGAPVRAFVEQLKNDRTWDNTRLFHAMDICMSLEESAHG